MTTTGTTQSHEGIEQDLFEQDIARQFAAWKATPGGRFILQQAYRIAAGQAERFKRHGQRGSVRLVWETLRYRLNWIRQCAAAKRVSLEKWGGYRLNDHFHAHVARHILEHRPDWDGLFEKRKLGAKRMVARRKVTVVEYGPTN